MFRSLARNKERIKRVGKYLITIPLLCVALLGLFTLGQATSPSKASVYDIPYVGEYLLDLDIDLYGQIAPVTSSISEDLSQSTAIHTVKAIISVGNGSGTVIYSELSPDDDGSYHNYALTNSHVVGKNGQIPVKQFLYLRDGQVTGHVAYIGTVVLTDPELDLALVRFRTSKPFEHTVSFVRDSESKNFRLYEKVYVAGCGASRPPFVTNGNLAQIGLVHHMVTAPAIFGNSGGAAFTHKGKLMGIVVAIGAVKDSQNRTHLATHIVSVISGRLVRAWLTINDYQRLLS
jgi:hypothetical protein